MPTGYIEIDGHRRTIAEWSDKGFAHAVAPKSPAESRLAVALLAALFDQCEGCGLTGHASVTSDTGKQTLVVAGSVDLIALARAALAATEVCHAR